MPVPGIEEVRRTYTTMYGDIKVHVDYGCEKGVDHEPVTSYFATPSIQNL